MDRCRPVGAQIQLGFLPRPHGTGLLPIAPVGAKDGAEKTTPIGLLPAAALGLKIEPRPPLQLTAADAIGEPTAAVKQLEQVVALLGNGGK
jgi:hypothetical protein